MRTRNLEKVFCLIMVIFFGLLATRCTTPKNELHAHGETASMKTYPKDYVHPLTEINLDKVINENRGLKVVEENATTVHDYYRGGVQEKAEGEKYIEKGKWEEARDHLEKSNRFLGVVLKYLSEDEAYRNIYGDHVVIFLPNLLMADNYLKLITVYGKLKMDDKSIEAKSYGMEYLSRSLKNVKADWTFQIKKGLEGGASKK